MRNLNIPLSFHIWTCSLDLLLILFHFRITSEFQLIFWFPIASLLFIFLYNSKSLLTEANIFGIYSSFLFPGTFLPYLFEILKWTLQNFQKVWKWCFSGYVHKLSLVIACIFCGFYYTKFCCFSLPPPPGLF